MEKPDNKYKRNTWWQDASGKRKFLMIGVDYLENPKDYFVDLWEVGKDKSKYIRLSIFESLIKEAEEGEFHTLKESKKIFKEWRSKVEK